MKADLPRALAQIGEIHALLGRTAVYRGYRSVPIAASGLIGLLAAAVQPRTLGAANPPAFAFYWIIVAAAAVGVGASEIVYNYLVRDDEHARRGTRQVLGQFLPGLAAGALLTLAFVRHGEVTRLLPAIWSICFATSIFGSLPYLPRPGAWVGVYYFVAGAVLLWMALNGAALSGWHVGGTFGIGQLLGAAVLYFTVERDDASGKATR